MIPKCSSVLLFVISFFFHLTVNIPKDLPKACKDAIAQVLETAPCTK